MKFNPYAHHRRSLRLPGYSYATPGAYFITVCACNRGCLFGEVTAGEMRLNECGNIVKEEWLKTGILRPYLAMDEFVVMPNHVHGIVIIDSNGSRGIARYAPTETTTSQFGHLSPCSIAAIVRAFKAAATRRVNELRRAPGVPVWQRGYYEHVIRGEDDLNSVREYVRYNPSKWAEDEENPSRI